MGAFCTCSRTSPFPNPDGFVEELGGGKRPRVTITVNGHSWKRRAAHHAGPALTQSGYPLEPVLSPRCPFLGAGDAGNGPSSPAST